MKNIKSCVKTVKIGGMPIFSKKCIFFLFFLFTWAPV